MGTEDTLSPLEGESDDTPKKTTKKLSREAAALTAKYVRKHRVENINRNQLAGVLDGYAAEGRVVIALNISRDIGGCYEVVSYKNEPVN